MKIRILKKLEYKGCSIYIRRLDKLFEYLIIYKGQLYSEYFEIKPIWYRNGYTEKQLQDIIRLVLSVAHKTIDKLKKKK